MTITPSLLTVGIVNVVADPDGEAWANEEVVCTADTGAVGTGIAWGTADIADNEGAGVADAGGSLIATGVGGTGTGMGLISNFSGAMGSPDICAMPFASTGRVNKTITKTRVRDVKAMRIQLVERFGFMGTLLSSH